MGLERVFVNPENCLNYLMVVDQSGKCGHPHQPIKLGVNHVP